MMCASQMKTAFSPRLAPAEPSQSRSREPAPGAVSAPRPDRVQNLALFDRASGGGAAEKVKSLFKLPPSPGGAVAATFGRFFLAQPDVGGWWDRHVERPFVMGRDGFVAVDRS